MNFEQIKGLLQEHNVDSDSAINDKEGAALFTCVASLSMKGEIVELGCYKGRSTIWLAIGSKLSGGEKVYAIDKFRFNEAAQKEYGNPQDSEPFFDKNIANCKVADIVVKLKGGFSEVAKTWDRPIKLLFIDGDHTYEGTRNNYLNWEPHLIEGGMVAFHDSNSNYPGVDRVIEEFIRKSGRFTDIHSVEKLTIAKKVMTGH